MNLLAEIQSLKDKFLHRRLRPVESAQGPVVTCGGRELLNFSSNDYLGLASDPRLIGAARDAAQKWGTGSGASRLLSGSLAVHHELEEATARYKREESAVLFSSGFLANLGAIQALACKSDKVWIDSYCQASVIAAPR